MQWRVIPVEINLPRMNMALDESCIEHVAKGYPPTIRFYDYSNNAAIIGYFQRMQEEVDIDFCASNEIDLVRRITGGGAMYLDKEGAITYSVIAPENLLPKGIHECYKEVSQWVINAFKKFGINAEFRPINDIVISNKKVSGSALTKKKNVVMIHGTILHSLNLENMFKVLKVPWEKISDKRIKSVEERVTSILHHKNVSKKEVYRHLAESFVDGKNFNIGKWTMEEMDRARYLMENKYKKEEWLFER